MQISYKDKNVRALCLDSKTAIRKIGADNAKKLKIRLAALEAASCVTELVAGRPHPLVGVLLGQFALDLAGGWRLVFSPANNPCPKNIAGEINWSQVTIVRIEYIGDYHG